MRFSDPEILSVFLGVVLPFAREVVSSSGFALQTWCSWLGGAVSSPLGLSASLGLPFFFSPAPDALPAACETGQTWDPCPAASLCLQRCSLVPGLPTGLFQPVVSASSASQLGAVLGSTQQPTRGSGLQGSPLGSELLPASPAFLPAPDVFLAVQPAAVGQARFMPRIWISPCGCLGTPHHAPAP